MQQSLSYFFLIGLMMLGAALWGRWAATDEKLKDGMTDFFLRSRWREVVARIVGGVGSWTFLWHLLIGLDGESARVVMASNALMVVVMLWVSVNKSHKYAANHAATPLFVRNRP
jgi:hypothetical protein